MGEAIEIMKSLIHCDECHHEFEGSPKDWLNKPCPKCQQGVLINDRDMAAATEFIAFCDGFNAAWGEVDEGAEMEPMEFSTASLRDKQ